MSVAAFRIASRLARAASAACAVTGLVAILGLAPVGCAGHQHLNDAPPHPIGVEVNNNLTVPTELTVYVTEDQGGSRLQVGTVPGGQTKTLSFTPVSWGQTYRLIAERQLERPLRSPPFTIPSGQTGTVAWNVVPNQVQLYDVADTTVAKPAPPASH
jgi:hypothetical protein